MSLKGYSLFSSGGHLFGEAKLLTSAILVKSILRNFE